MKKITALLLAVLLLSSAAAYADDAVTSGVVTKLSEPLVASDAQAQIDLMFANIAALNCDTPDRAYSYAITDLDHNGRLEFFAAICEGTGKYTSGRLFEVNADFKGLTEIALTNETVRYLPDVLTTSAQAYTDKASNTIHYIFPDVTQASAAESREDLDAVSYKNGVFSVKTIGSKNTYPYGAATVIECKDANGLEINPFEYSELASKTFPGCEISTVYFDWFRFSDAASAQRLTESYSVFTAEKKLNAVPAPVVTTSPQIIYTTSDPNRLFITKNPTSETVQEGGNAMFIANAQNYNYITWQLVSPNGYTVYNMNEAAWQFRGLTVNGDGTTQLVLCNCPLSLSGWSVQAVFSGYTEKVTTSKAYITVNKAARAQLYASPSSGYFEYSDHPIQLIANPGDTIHYEMTRSGGIPFGSGEVQSGGYCYIGAIADERYDVYLYAYVVGDPSNAISCHYVMDCLPSWDDVYDPSQGKYDPNSDISEYEQYQKALSDFMTNLHNTDLDPDTNYLDDLPIPPDWNGGE